MSTALRVAAVQFELRAETSIAASPTTLRPWSTWRPGGADLVVLPELVTTGLLASHPDAASLRVADVAEAYRSVFPPLAGRVRERPATARRRPLDDHPRRQPLPERRRRQTTQHRAPRPSRRPRRAPGQAAPDAPGGGDGHHPRRRGARDPDRRRTVAVQICADIEFPEVTRHLALTGVDLVLCPSLTWNRRGRQPGPLRRPRPGPREPALRGHRAARRHLRRARRRRHPRHRHGAVVAARSTACSASTTGSSSSTTTPDGGHGRRRSGPRAARPVAGRPEPPGLANIRPDLYAALAEPRGGADP